MQQVTNSNVAGLSQQQPQPLDYNKKWKSYILICVTSLTNFVSIGEAFDCDCSHHYVNGAHPNLNYMFGVVSFTVALLILLFDLVGFIRHKVKFDFKSLMTGKVEGLTLFILVLWWISGVISITRAGGVGYASLNIYLSSWTSLFVCIYTLDQWSGEQDLITLHELTRLSITLPSWWIVFWASIVTLGSGADAASKTTSDYVNNSCSVAVGISSITAIVSAFFIFSHYEFFPCCASSSSWLTYGGWFELACSIMVNIWLVIEVEQLTGAGAIASTINGNGGSDPNNSDYTPGTNIYIAVWAAFIASLRVTVKWKEARAIRFAQTSGAKSEEDEEDDDDIDNNDGGEEEEDERV